MRTKTRVTWLILILTLATGTILASCHSLKGKSTAPAAAWFHQIRGSLLETVEDPERSRKALILVDEFDIKILEYDAVAVEQSRRAKALNADYDATREDFEQLFAEIDASREAALDSVQEFFTELRAVLTEEEWSHINLSKSLVEVAS